MVKPPEGLDLGAPHVAHPEHDEVDVVAALGQQREAALPLAPPVATHEAVRKVPVQDGLCGGGMRCPKSDLGLR